MRITRRFSRLGRDVFGDVQWVKRTSRIVNADGSVVFEMTDAEVPKFWSQLATDIMVSKYFRKAGVPQRAEDGSPITDDEGRPVTGPERSVRQVVQRLAGCWRSWGERHGYFDTEQDAQAFHDELCFMLVHQMAAPNSPQWFNTGLSWAYGITGPAQGHWVADPRTGEAHLADDAYTHPQPHACFIQSISDDLVNPGGIMDLWVREARLFKYGSGTGTNFSLLRGEDEPLSGGGKSSGLLSFLRIGDRAAGAIKSGGTTRRAAKMVCLDADHPDIEAFVNWKVREELKVAAMVEGFKHLSEDQKALAATLGLELNYDFNGEAYYTVSGQNANNSVRLTDRFLEAVRQDGQWSLFRRTDGSIARTIRARALWDRICAAAWRSADPGLQFDTTINAWHTCPASGRINASNPCSEYMFLDDTACNLASLNLLRFYDAERRHFDVEGFEHAVHLWTVVLEISVLMAAYPSRRIAEQSHRFRTLGLGYANLGAMLMQAGIAYDSPEARAVCGAVTALMCGRSYATSAAMARELGAFPGFDENRHAMLRVIRNHRRAACGLARDSEAYEGLDIRPVPIDHELFARGAITIANAADLLKHATWAWDDALELGERHGYRNAQVTVIAPTGTIGLLMDCDTTGVEPDFALTKFKKLAGGGYFKIANQSLRPALRTLGYGHEQIVDILTYVMGTLSLDTPMPGKPGRVPVSLREYLRSKGYGESDLAEVSNALPSVFELSFAFTAWSMPEHVLRALGVGDVEAARRDRSVEGLRLLGLERPDIEALNLAVCGTQTVEGAPHLRPEHLAIFDCANRCGRLGSRFIRPEGHIRMMAAAQPFISGAISKTINLPAEATIEDVAAAYWLSWDLGLKADAIYRDGSKLSQPLSTTAPGQEGAGEREEVASPPEDILGEASAGDVAPASATSTCSTSTAAMPESVPAAAAAERVVERIIERPMRRRLPDTRRSITHRFNVAGHEGYLTAGLYDDGSPGELFITMSKEGSTIGGLMDSLGTAISVALQYGVPLDSLVRKFEHQRFEPMGITTNRDIPFAKSLVDYIFRWLGMNFIEGYREANAPKRTEPAATADASRRVTEDSAWSEEESSDAADDRLSGPSEAPHGANGGHGAHGVHGSARPLARRARPARTAEPRTTPTAATRLTAVHTESVHIEGCADGSARMIAETTDRLAVVSPLDHSHAALQGDAPACEVCGAITVRSGTCYRCCNCGNSMGCS